MSKLSLKRKVTSKTVPEPKTIKVESPDADDLVKEQIAKTNEIPLKISNPRTLVEPHIPEDLGIIQKPIKLVIPENLLRRKPKGISKAKSKSSLGKNQNISEISPERQDPVLNDTPIKPINRLSSSEVTPKALTQMKPKPKSSSAKKQNKKQISVLCHKLTEYFSACGDDNHNKLDPCPSTSKSKLKDVTPLKQNDSPDAKLTVPTSALVADIVDLTKSDDEQKPKKTVNKGKKNIKKKTKVVRAKKEIPSYKILEDSTFAVDAFNYGTIPGVSHYFLTHYHADHYIGLTKKFASPIFMSRITGNLVKEFLKVDPEFINIVNVGEWFIVEDVKVMPLVANHCPGAVMFFFIFPDGRTILHTGDFRASPDMESFPVFWEFSTDIIYLDTTYLPIKQSFQSQIDSIDEVSMIVETFQQKNVNGAKFLIVCGSYLIGKEKVWIRIAQENKFKVWVEPNRRKALECFENSELMQLLEECPTNAQIHVLPMTSINHGFLDEYLLQYEGHFNMILAIRPSGWERKTRPFIQNNVHIYGVEYSEHSSFDELRRFVKFVQPKRVIPTVPLSKYQMPKIPNNWLDRTVRPLRNYQPTLSTLFKTKAADVKPNGSLLKLECK